MNKKIQIDVDAEPWITEDGIEISVFIGEGDDRIEYQYTWSELIHLMVDAHVLYGFDDKIVFLKNDDALDKFQKIAKSVERGASKIYEMLDNAYVFDREAWLESNDGVYNEGNKNEFLDRVVRQEKT